MSAYAMKLFRRLEDVVLAIASPRMLPTKPQDSSLMGSWYLSPGQHAIEFLITNIINFWMVFGFMNKALAQCESGLKKFIAERAQQKAPKWRVIIDHLLLISFIVIYVATWYYKYQRKWILFMLQPCHVNVLMFIIIFSIGRKRKLAHVLFNLILHLNWGPALAILTPDLRDCDMYLEKEFFWFEHYLLMVVPAYCILTKSLHVFPLSWTFILASFFSKALYHSALLGLVGVMTAVNLNYMLSPPPGLLEWFGLFYRPVMYAASLVLTILMRIVIWGSFQALSELIHGKEIVDATDKKKEK